MMSSVRRFAARAHSRGFSVRAVTFKVVCFGWYVVGPRGGKRGALILANRAAFKVMSFT
jgi:hypothetical protein